MKLTNIDDLAANLINQSGIPRMIVAIAGPPGVGKSTFTEKLCGLINEQQAGICAILPMDGYHYDNIYLEKMGWLANKGASHTFDVAGYAHMLARLAQNDEPEIAVPVFDRSIEIARAGARLIPNTAKIILTEGNYLLLNKPPWDGLLQYFDQTIMLSAPEETIIVRLEQRWKKHQYSKDAIVTKMQENDLPNVKMVINNSINADYLVKTA